jgi:hypothetical protein
VFCHFLGTIANSWVSPGSNGIPNSSNPASGYGANPFRTRPGQPGFGMNSGKKVPSLLPVVLSFILHNRLVLAVSLRCVNLMFLNLLVVFHLH